MGIYTVRPSVASAIIGSCQHNRPSRRSPENNDDREHQRKVSCEASTVDTYIESYATRRESSQQVQCSQASLLSASWLDDNHFAWGRLCQCKQSADCSRSAPSLPQEQVSRTVSVCLCLPARVLLYNHVKPDPSTPSHRNQDSTTDAI